MREREEAQNEEISEFMKKAEKSLWRPFTQEKTAPVPLIIDRGAGAYLYTAGGEKILDLISSWWVSLHGHAHPYLVAALDAQARKLEHVIFADVIHRPAVDLGYRLTTLSGMDRVFFSDNGSTAVEVALKMAVQYQYNRGKTGRRLFLSLEKGYHGDTFGAMSAGYSSGFFSPFGNYLFEVAPLKTAPRWDCQPEELLREWEAESLKMLDRLLDKRGEEVLALIVEPLIQGAGGMILHSPAWLLEVCRRVRSAGGLLIFDEVMTGFYRTGRLFGFEHLQAYDPLFLPDLVCLSKALSGGMLPFAVTLCREFIHEAFLGESLSQAFLHGHSFTANPLGCACALASLDLLEEASFPQNVGRVQAAIAKGLEPLRERQALCRIRQQGLVGAFDVKGSEGYGSVVGQKLKEAYLRAGLLIRPLGGTVYVLPPVCLTDEQLANAWTKIYAVTDKVLAESL